MAKFKYIIEFEINSSVNILYPYLSSASGLQEWFADEVNIIGDKLLDIVWDGESHPAKIVSKRVNNHIKYSFVDAAKEQSEDAQTLEFRVDYNEMTSTSFLKVIDYSEMNNEEDLQSLWEGMVEDLKKVVGSGNS